MKARSLLVAVSFSLSAPAVSADPDTNVEIMAEASRQLSWDYENRAYFLVKQETIVAPVALVFGYGDNSAACQELATALSQPEARTGTFECVPVY